MMRSRSTSVKQLSAAEVREENVDTLFMVWLTSRATSDLLNRTLTASGLDGDEFAIYSVLTAAPSITPTELARWMAAPTTTVSSYVKRFEARGHIVREHNPDDRRSYRIGLTPAGRRAYRIAAAAFTPLRKRVAEALGARTDDIREALMAVRTAVDELRHPTDEGAAP
jgi:DNA-binding MarR family transcriptional regulator